MTIQIEDGEEFYPESCVEYVRFRSYDLQLMFSYFREREWVHMVDLDILKNEEQWVRDLLRTKLEEVQSHLAFMVSNLPGRAEKGRRRKRKV